MGLKKWKEEKKWPIKGRERNWDRKGRYIKTRLCSVFTGIMIKTIIVNRSAMAYARTCIKDKITNWRSKQRKVKRRNASEVPKKQNDNGSNFVLGKNI